MSSPYACEFDPDVTDDASFLELLAYWQDKRAGRELPLRAAIDPLELRRHLGSLGMIECLPEFEDFRFRLIGSRIVETYGRDSTGKTVGELYAQTDPAFGDFLRNTLRHVATHKLIARCTGSLRPVDRDYRRFDSLLLPLDGGDGAVGWILNGVHFS